MKIPADAFVVGHVGRLAAEKNLGYLAEAVALFLKDTPNALFLVVGGGPAEDTLKEIFSKHGVTEKLILAGKQTGRALHHAYRAMDVFAFASFSETQGMVLAEAMAAGLPVVALDASGVREVVHTDKDGFMLPADATPEVFAAQLRRLHHEPGVKASFAREAQVTAEKFSREHSAERALAFYAQIRKATRRQRELHEASPWGTFRHRVSIEWDLLAGKAQAVVQAVTSEKDLVPEMGAPGTPP